jgi:hypothetical protein
MRFAARLSLLALAGTLVLAGGLTLTGCQQTSDADAADPEGAAPTVIPDLIVIAHEALFGSLERPPVEFPHDRHARARQEAGEDCTACHVAGPSGRLSPFYLRPEPESAEPAGDGPDAGEVLELYHQGCIGCHQELREAGSKSGPVTCGECHRRQPRFVSDWQPIGFDKSLHFRHIDSHQGRCEACHHDVDEATGQLVYIKGHEASCRVCHRETTVDGRLSLRRAVHGQCIHCHRTEADAGPIECGGCHDPVRQARIAHLDVVPRLERGQPDVVLLAAAESERAESKLPTVPFSHVGHEEALPNCRVCHHEGMQACSDCHTLEGEAAGGDVTLRQAMHRQSSSHSCVGCHDVQKASVECAGCHGLMEQGRLTEHACRTCHSGPLPADLPPPGHGPRSLDRFRPPAAAMRLSFASDDVPEEISIDVVARRLAPGTLPRYGPAGMPHRRIIETLQRHIGASRVATYFHGHEDVLCQGCHHHSPVGQRPPLCESCHGEPFQAADLYKPGLYGAYHRQCIGCHESMQLTQPAGCTGCHAEQDGSVEVRARADGGLASTVLPGAADDAGRRSER